MNKSFLGWSYIVSSWAGRVIKKTLPGTIVAVFMLLGTTLFAVPNLVFTSNVTTTTPGGSDVFLYKFRYRVASVTENAENAQIVIVIPGSLDVVNLPSPGGNISNVTQSGQTITITLASPGQAPILQAGASGLIDIGVRFKCGMNGMGGIPAAGTPVNFSPLPVFSITGNSVTTNPPTVTTPTASACPAGGSGGAPGDISKYFDFRFTTPGMVQFYNINIPAHTGPEAFIETLPDYLYITNLGELWPTGYTIEVEVAGTWYTISGGSFNNFGSWFADGNANGGILRTAALSPIPGCNIQSDLRAEGSIVYYSTCVDRIRVTSPAGANGNALFQARFFTDENIPLNTPTFSNCVTSDGAPFSATACSSPQQVFDLPFLDGSCEFGSGLGSTTMTVGGNNIGASYPGTSKTPLDILVGLTVRGTNLASGFVKEFLLPPGFDFVTTGPDANFWLMDNTRPVDWTGQPGCMNPNFVRVPNYNGTGRVLLRWEFPNCNLPDDYGVNPVGTLDGGIWLTFKYMQTTPLTAGQSLNTVSTVRRFDNQNFIGYFEGARNFDNQDCNYTVPTTSSTDASKYVKGALDTDFSRYPAIGNTNLNGEGSYEITVRNLGTTGVKQLDIADVLPFLNDNDLLNNTARGSGWSVELSGPIVVERFTIGAGLSTVSGSNLPIFNYSTSTNPCYLFNDPGVGSIQVDADPLVADLNAGCTDFNNATSAANARAFSLRWQDNTTPLAFSEYLKITVPIRQLTGEADALNNEISWNSLAYTAIETDNDELLSSEPIKVGLKMVNPATTAGIGNFVWYDNNANGIQDAGEPGVAGVRVSLYDGSGQPVTETVLVGGVPTAIPVTTLTDTNGNYNFFGLTPTTNYTVRLDNTVNFNNGGPLDNYVLTTLNAGSNDELDSDAALGNVAGSAVPNMPQIAAPTLAANTVTNTYDFGFYQPATIGNYVWYDTDMEGDQDVTETGVPGVTVQLFNQAGTLVATTTTDANGLYLFSNVVPGAYYLQFSNYPGGFIPTASNTTGDDTNDSDINPSNNQIPLFVVNSGDNNLTFDVGLSPIPPDPATITGTVYDDLNKDGIDDPNDPGVAGVTVFLLNATTLAVMQSVLTDANGDYTFSNLNHTVDYIVQVQPPTITTMFTTGVGGDMDVNATTGESATINPAPNSTTVVDAGLMGLYSIGNQVFTDVNGNSIFNPGTDLVNSGVVVRLINGTDMTTVLSTTVTDGNGRYVFTALNPGSYIVEVEIPAGLASVNDIGSTPTPNNTDNDDNGVGTSSNPGTVRSNVLVLAATPGSPGDANWTEYDANQLINGVQDVTSNPRAYYTVDFGFFLLGACPVLSQVTATTPVCAGSTFGVTITHTNSPGNVALYYSTNGSLTAAQLYNFANHAANGIVSLNNNITPSGTSTTVPGLSISTGGNYTIYAILANGNASINSPSCLPMAQVAAIITALPAATFSQTPPTCTGATPNNNGIITFATATGVTHFGISTAGAATYDGPAYPATAFTAIGQNVSATIPNTGGSFIVRVFNSAANCFTDITVSVAPVTCVALCVPPVLSSTPGAVCAGNIIDLTTLINGNSPVGTLSFHGTLADANAGTNPLVNTVVSPSGNVTYYVRSTVSATCFSTGTLTITVANPPSLSVSNGQICAGNSINLATLVADSGGGTLSYFTSLANAQTNTNPLASGVVAPVTATNYFIRSTGNTGCFRVENIVVSLQPTTCGAIQIMGPN